MIAGTLVLAYAALALFGGRIPSISLVLPVLPLLPVALAELVWQDRHRSAGWEERPAWMRLMGVVANLLCIAIVAGLLVRYYLL